MAKDDPKAYQNEFCKLHTKAGEKATRRLQKIKSDLDTYKELCEMRNLSPEQKKEKSDKEKSIKPVLVYVNQDIQDADKSARELEVPNGAESVKAPIEKSVLSTWMKVAEEHDLSIETYTFPGRYQKSVTTVGIKLKFNWP